MNSLLVCFCLILCLGSAFATNSTVESIGSTDKRTCDLYIAIAGVQLLCTNPVSKGYTASDEACLAACPWYLAGSRRKSTGACTCIQQPFAANGISGVANSDYNAWFNPNTPTYGCSSSTIGGQKFMFGSRGTLGDFYTPNVETCAETCADAMRSSWTRQSSTGNCWCGTGKSWQSNAVLYDPDFWMGSVALF